MMYENNAITDPLIPLRDDNELKLLNNDSSQHIIEINATTPEIVTISVWQIANGLSTLVFSAENCPRIGGAIFLSCLSTGLNVLSPTLLSEALVALNSDNKQVTFASHPFSAQAIVSALVLSYGLAQVIPNLVNQIMTPVTANNIKKLIQDSAQHLLEKSLHYHANTLPADQFYFIQKGFTLSTISTPLLTQIFPMMIQIPIAGILLSSQFGVELGASLLVLLAIYVGYSAFTAKAVIKENDALLIAWNESYAELMATIDRYKIIHDYGKFNTTLHHLDNVLTECWKNIFVRATTIPIKVSYGHSVISFTHMLLAALYVAHGIDSGKYTVQDFVIIVGYLLQLSNLMPAFGQAINQMFAAYPDLKFVFTELANHRDKIGDQAAGDEFPNLGKQRAPSIEFANISYRHQPRPQEKESPLLFQHLSFTIPSNQLVAIVSESGVGKTTLLHLLARHYPITSGNGVITINGQDINSISLESLRRHITVFYRDPQLFKGSLRDNIAFGVEGNKAVSDVEIEAIARQANLYDFIASFPQQLDTIIGPGGATLSDGQQQKVAILRGLMKKSPIWLLDEVTSALDPESATQLLDAIHAASQNVTVLMITHKLHEVAHYANQVVVINKQSQVEQGTHQELLEQSTLYRNLWQKCTNHSSSTKGKSSALGLFASGNKNLLDIEDQGSELDLFKNGY